MNDTAPLVQIDHLSKVFRSRSGLLGRTRRVVAVDDLSLTIAQGETLGLVGESGSGKTTLGRLLLRLIAPTAGTVLFEGVDVFALESRALRAMRQRMQIVFQDSTGSLDPRMTVGAAVREPIAAHHLYAGSEADARVAELFGEVGLDLSLIHSYPHELSGGQRQRVGIARALSVEPKFMVLDEPVTALDVSVQAQVLNLLADLRGRRGLTYLFIAHDLAVVRHLAHRVAVMYFGNVVEVGQTADLYSHPLHPYTASLLAAVPVPDPAAARAPVPLRGEPPSDRHRPSGCPFHPRCLHPKKDERCRTEAPALREPVPARQVACHYGE